MALARTTTIIRESSKPHVIDCKGSYFSFPFNIESIEWNSDDGHQVDVELDIFEAGDSTIVNCGTSVHTADDYKFDRKETSMTWITLQMGV